MNLLITGAWNADNDELNCIRKLGHEIFFMKNENEQLPCPYEKVEGVICNALFLHHHIDMFTSLKYIQLTSAGMDRVDVKYISESGITIKNATGVYSIPMAEFAISSVLSLYKEDEHFRNAQDACNWSKHRGLRELYEKCVCIVGCGSVGDECAKRFSAFGCKIIGIDVEAKTKPVYDEIYHIRDLNRVLPYADILLITLPLNDNTYHLIKRSELEMLPENGIVVNISRGGIVDTEDLIEILKSNKISAVLDVFEMEPLSSDSALWSLPNVLITPHNSFVGEGNKKRLWNLIYRNLVSYDENSYYISKE